MGFGEKWPIVGTSSLRGMRKSMSFRSKIVLGANVRSRRLTRCEGVQARVFSLPLVVAVGGCAGTPPVKEAIPAVDFAAYSERARTTIEERLETAVAQPESADALGLAAMALHAYEVREPAMELYRRASHSGPSDYRWHYLRGLLAREVGSPAESLESLRTAARLETEQLFVKLRLATALLDADRPGEALEVYDQLPPEQHNSMAVHLGRGRCLTRLGRPNEALAELERAASYARDYRPLYYHLALALRRVGREEEALRFLALYERSKPDPRPSFPDPLLNELQDLREGSYLHHLNRGARLEAAGSLEEAEGEYLRALEAEPDHVHARVNLISVYGKLGRYEDATAAYRQALELNSEAEEAHFNYGVMLSLLGRLTEAGIAYGRALDVNPYSADSRLNLGDIFERQNRREEAAEQFRRVLDVNSGHRLANFRLGMLLFRSERRSEALRHLGLAVEVKDRETPQFLIVLARAERAIGNIANAARHAAEARRMARQYDLPEILAILDSEFPPE